MTAARDFWARLNFERRLAIVVALGAVWRYGYVIAVKWNQTLLLNDSLYYSWQAAGLTRGEFFKDITGKREAAEHGPLTSIVLAPVSWGAHAVDQQRLLTATLGVVTVALIGIVARRMAASTEYADRVGIVAAGIAAAYPNLWINDGLVMSESLGALLVVLILLALVDLTSAAATRRTRISRAVAFGMLVGLGALTRSELILAIVFGALVILLWVRPLRHAAAMIGLATLVTSVVIAPWIIFNQTRFDEGVTLSTNDGTTLIGANCPETYYSPPALGGWSLFCVLDVQGPPGADDSIRARIQRDTAISYAKHHLTRLPLVGLARFGRTIDVFKIGNLVHQDEGEEKATWAIWSGIVCWWVLTPLAGLGLIKVAKRRERSVLLVPVVIVVVTSVVFYGTHRLRVTLEPVVVIGAAMFACSLVARRTSTLDAAPSTGGPDA